MTEKDLSILEKEFKEALERSHPEFLSLVEALTENFKALIKLSEETGIPFKLNDKHWYLRRHLSGFRGDWQTQYVPNSFHSKFGELGTKHNTLYHLTDGKLESRFPINRDNWVPSQEC